MPIRAMLFIDGGWLYHLIPQLRRLVNDWQFKIDYSKIPSLVQSELARQMGTSNDSVYIMRTNIFGALPCNIDPADQQDMETQQAFYSTMSELYLFDTFVHEISYSDQEGAHRLRAKDRRESDDPWNPKEKCVDVDLTSSMMAFAAGSGGYDIGVLIAGDRDYVPLLRNIRKLGKRVMIVGARNSTANIYINSSYGMNIRDFETVLLDEHLKELELVWEEKEYTCAKCEKKFVTDFQPRRYQRVFCDDCRQEHRKTKGGGHSRDSDEGGASYNIENAGNFKRYQS